MALCLVTNVRFLMAASFLALPLTFDLFAADDSGLREETIAQQTQGPPIFWRDFHLGEPASAIRVMSEDDLEAKRSLPQDTSYWLVRRPGWTPALLNAAGEPPEITFDPGVEDECDLWLGLRAVDPRMTFDIKLTGDQEFTTITAPAATSTHHFDFEFHWRARTALSGRKIIVRSRGKPLYLQYVKFIPYRQAKITRRVPAERIAVLEEKSRHFAFPGVAELPGGELVVVCREGDAHVCPRGSIVLTRSRDGGKTWLPREVIYDSPSDERDPAVLCLADGTLVVSFCTWDSWRDSPSLRAKYAAETAHMEKVGWGKYSGIWLVVSKDNGRTWSEPRAAPAYFSPHGPVVGPEQALYWIAVGAADGRTAVVIHRTADLGRTWQRWSEVAFCGPYDYSHPREFWDEPNLLFLPDAKAIATFRVERDGLAWQSYSKDDGRTWSWPKPTAVWGFPQQLCLLRDGRILMAYGFRKTPFSVRACTSSDGGRSYDLAREIVFRHDGEDDDLGYPYSIQLHDGRLLTVYYFHREDTNCYIEAAMYRP
ncbi:MAG: exo-alpha-sialidase [Pirellulales bacterium]|nr:exo-alpha-sialidase [Pirellulales bacterium]